jgi:hypothetical protein
MELPQRYTLACLTDYAGSATPYGYNAITDNSIYKFQHRRYMDETRNVRQEWMVRVGHYFTHYGKQVVWARPTGLDIQYYHGELSALELEIVEDRFRARIYFEEPFCYIAGEHNGALNDGHKYGIVATEMVINFVGLHNGWIVHVDNEKNIDVLAAFYHACINFEPRRENEAEEQRCIEQQKIDKNEAAQANAWGRRGNHWPEEQWPHYSYTSPSSYPKGKKDQGSSSPKVKDEPMDDDDDRVYNRNFRFPRTPVRSTPTPGISLTHTRGTPSCAHPYRRKFSSL